MVKKETLHLKDVTMIYLVTEWFDVAQHEDKRATSIVNLVETMWLSRYLIPTEIMYDQGIVCIGHEFRKYLIEMEYGIVPVSRWNTLPP